MKRKKKIQKNINTENILNILPKDSVKISDKELNEILYHYSNHLESIEITKLKSIVRDQPLYSWGGRRAGKKNPMAKEFIFISPPPKCEIFYVVGEARKFCQEHNISFNALYYQYRNRRVPPPPPLDSPGPGGIRRVRGFNEQLLNRRINTTGWIMRF